MAMQYNYDPAQPQLNYAHSNAPGSYVPYPSNGYTPPDDEAPVTAPPYQFGQIPPPTIPVVVVPIAAPTLDPRRYSNYVCLGFIIALVCSPIFSLFTFLFIRDPRGSIFLRRIDWGVALIIPGSVLVTQYNKDCMSLDIENSNTSPLCNSIPGDAKMLGRGLLVVGILLVIWGFIIIRISVKQWRRIITSQSTTAAVPNKNL